MKLRFFFCFLLVFLMGWSANILAQITTTVSKKKITLDEVLYVTYNYSGDNPIINKSHVSFAGFQVVSAGEQMSNFQDYSYTYVLQPTKLGTFKIPGMTIVTKNGKQYVSSAINIEVVAGSTSAQKQSSKQSSSINSNWRQRYINEIKQSLSRMDTEDQMLYLFDQIQDIETAIVKRIYDSETTAELKKVKKDLEGLLNNAQRNPQVFTQSSPSQSVDIQGREAGAFFVRAVPSKSQVHIGEPIEVTYKFYFSSNFSNGAVQQLPKLDGFNSREYPHPERPRPYVQVYNGRRYNVVDAKKSLLFPTRSGQLVLDPLVLTALTESQGKIEIASDSVYINVKPLPENNNSYFTGGVGNFGITTSIDKMKFSTDDPATFYFTIAGKGNWEIIDAPVINNLPDHVTIGSPSIETEGDESNLLFGKKMFKYHIVVDEAGQYEIPSIPFTFFDSEKNEYVTIHSEPIKIEVEQGVGVATLDDTPKDPRQMQEIEVGALPGISNMQPWAKSPVYYTLLGLLLAGIPLLVRVSANKETPAEKKKNNPAKANKVAMARLKTAQGLLQNSNNALFYEEISKSIWLYLSDKLRLPLSELSKETLQSKLKERNIEDDTIQNTLQLIQECEMALYAGMQGQQQKQWAMDNAMNLITKYESQL